MNANEALTLTLLAVVDAAFEPFRLMKDWRAAQSIWQARAAYLAGGAELPGGGGGGDEASWKSAERQRKSAAAEGLIELCGTGRRYSGIKLTSFGEARARASVGMKRLHDAWPQIDRIRWLTTTPEGQAAGHGWECAVADMNYDPGGCGWAFAILGGDLLPGLTRGWIQSNADCFGRVAYCMGPREDEMPVELPESEVFYFPEDELPPQHAADALYWNTRDAARERLMMTAAPNKNDIVIPLSAGLWPDIKFPMTAPSRAEVDTLYPL